MTDHAFTFSSLLRRRNPLAATATERLATVRAQFDPVSDVTFVYGCAMYAAIPLELALKMILNLLQDLGKINIIGTGRFKESILDSKAMLGDLKVTFCDYLKSLNIPIPELFYTELDRCHLYRNELAHKFWVDYARAYNNTQKADEAIMRLVGCIDVFHHTQIELLDTLEELAKVANHNALVNYLVRLKNIYKNESSYKSYREYVEACFDAARTGEDESESICERLVRCNQRSD